MAWGSVKKMHRGNFTFTLPFAYNEIWILQYDPETRLHSIKMNNEYKDTRPHIIRQYCCVSPCTNLFRLQVVHMCQKSCRANMYINRGRSIDTGTSEG
jgi:hypothetical protein